MRTVEIDVRIHQKRPEGSLAEGKNSSDNINQQKGDGCDHYE
jgi:hypothetical protein